LIGDVTMDIKEKMRINSLYDIYGELLTDKQKEYFEYYYRQDYSLSEIADILSVSRNAVHMQLKNVVGYLENYENKLKMLKNREKIDRIIEKIDSGYATVEEIKTELEKV